MKIYVASHSQEKALEIAKLLQDNGHHITSRWIYQPFNDTVTYTETQRQQIAEEDTDDVLISDILVLIAGPDKYSGGKFVEAGIAIGANKPVIIIGRRENMLLWHKNIIALDDPQILPETLKEFKNCQICIGTHPWRRSWLHDRCSV
jgi:nucleoside 2-deoxyribosyltransferase